MILASTINSSMVKKENYTLAIVCIHVHIMLNMSISEFITTLLVLHWPVDWFLALAS